MTVIDGADNSTATVNAGSYPLAIAVNPTTNKVYAVNNSNAYGENATMGTVTVIDGPNRCIWLASSSICAANEYTCSFLKENMYLR